LPDNDNNSLLDPKVRQQALLELSKRLSELHQAIDTAGAALARLRQAPDPSCEPTGSS